MRAELSPSFSNFTGPPALREKSSFRLMYHGVANKNRNLELYFNVIDLLPSCFRLDLFLVETDAQYLNKIRKLAKSNSQVNVIEGLDHSELSERFRGYDIGLFLAFPTTFNLDHSWPNKVFDYLAQGMWVVATPLSGMRELSKAHKKLVVSDDWSPEAIASIILSRYEAK